MSVDESGTTVHVVRTDREVEVFSSADEAWRYAACKRGATTVERRMRGSLSEAQVVYERRVHVVDGVVRLDTTIEEPFFTIGPDSWIPVADVESFEAKDERWTILGLGTERSQIDQAVDREIARLTSGALWSLPGRRPA